MTKSQERAIEKIRQLAERHMDECFGGEGEIKRWEIDDCEYFISVVVEIGVKNDRGTWASIICRDRAQLFVGKRGGIRYPVFKQYKNGECKQITRVFKGYSILQAVVDQR